MTTWQDIPTLVGTGAAAVHRFAEALGLDERLLRQSDWEEIPYLKPVTSQDPDFDWQQQTYGVYRVRTVTRDLWLFWFALRGWQKGEFLPLEAEVVAHWEQPEESMVTRCAYRTCQSPALTWPGPALSMTIEIHRQSYFLNLYACSDAHRAELGSAQECTLQFRAPKQDQVLGSILALQTLQISPPAKKQEISTRTGRIEGSPYDQWVIVIPDLWQTEEIEIIEATLSARLQEHYDHFQEYGGGFWRLSVSYNHQRFEARCGSNQLEASTAQELADEITQDYAALRRYWKTQ